MVFAGVMLWALLAPIGALFLYGWQKSIPWFLAYIVLTAVSGFIDYHLESGMPGSISSMQQAICLINFAVMSLALYLLLCQFTLETEKIETQLCQERALLEVEREKSEQVLFNVLPLRIAERLKRNERLIADGYADVTVMFADLVNFTQITEQLSPQQMVNLLNELFSDFDELTDKLGLEKIKTIGDAYMVAGGLTYENLDYVVDIADLALEMVNVVDKHPFAAKLQLGLHVGIATGPVVAGVIGTRRFKYDLWGDTVNIASRLTDDAPAGHILTDALTYKRLQHDFLFDPPNVLDVKGKGKMVAFRLVGRPKRSGESDDNVYRFPLRGNAMKT